MTFLFQLLAVSESLLFAEMQPIFATFVAKLPIISVKSLSLYQVLTKVESRHDSTNHASILAFAAPRIENN